MSAAEWGYLFGNIGITIVVAYVILAVFLIKPLHQHKMVGVATAAAVTALLTLASASVSMQSALNWIGWAIAMAFIAWRATRSMQPPAMLGHSATGAAVTTPVPVIVKSLSLITPVGKSRNYFIRHWQGDFSLATSYWINGALIAAVLPLALLAIINHQVPQAESLRAHALTYVIAVIVILALWLWGIVGIWRSSNNHVARGGQQGWATVAKVMVVLGTISTTGQMLSTYLPMLKEMGLIALGEDPIGGYKATVLSDGKSILISGMLREGAAKEIEKLLDSVPAVDTLVLSSNGGRILEGKLLATVVNKRSLNTYVEDVCVSTCTLVFLAGKERAATPNAKIGFHTPSFPGNNPETLRAGTEFMMDVYRHAGLRKQFLDKVTNTPATGMWYPTSAVCQASMRSRVTNTPATGMWYPTMEELIEARVIT